MDIPTVTGPLMERILALLGSARSEARGELCDLRFRLALALSGQQPPENHFDAETFEREIRQS